MYDILLGGTMKRKESGYSSRAQPYDFDAFARQFINQTSGELPDRMTEEMLSVGSVGALGVKASRTDLTLNFTP